MTGNERSALVSTLWAAGFRNGPDPSDPCEQCGHLWGNHLAITSNPSPLDGGYYACPHNDGQPCMCYITWDLATTDGRRITSADFPDAPL